MPNENSQAAKIIAKFGGTTALSRELGIGITSVHKWKVGGWIPSWWQKRVLEAGQRKRVGLKMADFFKDAE